MPTLKILIGDKLVDAEIVVHEGALFAKVPDEYLRSSMPLMTARLEAQTEAVGLLLRVGDLVRAAEERFPKLDKKQGAARADGFAREYQLCRELYEAGKFDLVKKNLAGIRGRVRREMMSLELKELAEKELKKDKKGTKKLKVTEEVDKDGKKRKVFQMVGRFDGARLEAKLFGAETGEPVGELLNLPNEFSTSGFYTPTTCSCQCEPPSIDESGSIGYLVVARRYSYGTLECQYEYLHGDSSNKVETTSCFLEQAGHIVCQKIRDVFFPEASS
jgi:hypothetical protein